MVDTISYTNFIDRSPDDQVWIPIPENEFDYFDSLVEQVRESFKSNSNHQKGDSMEALMSYVYKRFKIINVLSNQRTRDNEIDHRIEFIDGMVPTFINDHIGLQLIGESKNHRRSISSRDVSNLDELLRNHNCKMGIFSSYKTFSKGSSMWINAEGKRRKLALWNQYKRIIVGFTIDELSTLKTDNFYTMLKQKYYQIIEELDDNVTDNDLNLPYQDRLHNSLLQLHRNGIIDDEQISKCKTRIINKYGPVSDHEI